MDPTRWEWPFCRTLVQDGQRFRFLLYNVSVSLHPIFSWVFAEINIYVFSLKMCCVCELFSSAFTFLQNGPKF